MQRYGATTLVRLCLISLVFTLAACSKISTDALPDGGADLETQAANLVTNPGFNKTDGWTSYFDAPVTGSFLVSNGAAKLNIQNADGVDWKVQLYQAVSIQKSASYTLTFKARASAARPLRIALRNSSSYNDVWSKTLNLTTSLKTFGPFTFSANAAKDRQLIFYMGQNSKDVYIDDVTFKVDDSAPPSSGSTTNPYGGSLAPDKTTADKLISDLYAKWKRERLAYAPSKGLQPGEITLTTNVQFKDSSGKPGMVSEGLGYGMLLSAYNNDKATFTGIWKFTKRNLNSRGLVPWLYDSNSRVVDANNATDGDLDVALALIVAYKRGWNDSYKQDATNLINNLMTYTVRSDNVITAGAVNPKDVINTSYIMPGHFKVFAAFTGNSRWNKVADANYALLKKALDKPNVVLPAHGVTLSGEAASAEPNFDSDAGRGPFRVSTDYAWYGDSRAKALMVDYNKFFESKGLSNLCESYTVYGNQISRWCGSDAGWIASSSASSQLAENDSASRRAAWNALSTAFTGDYYSFELTQLGILLTSGRFYNPLQ